MYKFEWGVIPANAGYVLSGLANTFLVAVSSMIIGIFLGLLIATIRIMRVPILSQTCYVYVEFIRSIPLLLALWWLYQVLPLVSDITLSAYSTAVIAFGLYVGGFTSEIFRAGIASIDVGQWRAAMSLGMSPSQVWRRVILPQAVPRIIPPLGTTWVAIFKDTSIIFIVGVSEVMFRAQNVALATFRPMEIYTFVVIIYFVVAWPQARLIDKLYERFRIHE